MTDSEVPKFTEYAKIHQKIEFQANLRAISEGQIHRLVITPAGLRAKKRLLELIEGNISNIESWAGRTKRSDEEVRIARSMYCQYRTTRESIEAQIPRIDIMLRRMGNVEQGSFSERE